MSPGPSLARTPSEGGSGGSGAGATELRRAGSPLPDSARPPAARLAALAADASLHRSMPLLHSASSPARRAPPSETSSSIVRSPSNMVAQ